MTLTPSTTNFLLALTHEPQTARQIALKLGLPDTYEAALSTGIECYRLCRHNLVERERIGNKQGYLLAPVKKSKYEDILL